MKKIFFVLLITCVFSTSTFAQDKAPRKERIEAMRVAFITEKIQLTVEESQQFWPIYNEYTASKKALRKDMKIGKKATEMSESEADALLYKVLEIEDKEIALKREYLEKMKKIISSQKIVKLYQAEKKFRSELVKRLKQERQ